MKVCEDGKIWKGFSEIGRERMILKGGKGKKPNWKDKEGNCF